MEINSTPQMLEKSEALFLNQLSQFKNRELRPRWLRIVATPVVIQSFQFRWHCKNCMTILNFEDKSEPCKKCRLIKNQILNAELTLDVEDGTGKCSLIFTKPQLIWSLFFFSPNLREMVESEAAKRPLGLCYRTSDYWEIDFDKIAELEDEALKMMICEQTLYERPFSFICSFSENPTYLNNTLNVEHVEQLPIHQEAYRLMSLLTKKQK